MDGVETLDILHRPAQRGVPQVAIVPSDEGFDILAEGERVLTIEDELDAHHWAKHVTECVNSGVRGRDWIRECLPKLCETATRANLHTGFPAAS
jgi:hypothetical protein